MAANPFPNALSIIDSSSPHFFFIDTRYALAPFQFGKHVVGTETVPRQHDQTVKPEIGSFANDMKFITVLRRKQGLGRLLTDLLQDGIVAFREQASHVGMSASVMASIRRFSRGL
jgi:hypothetical protein